MSKPTEGPYFDCPGRNAITCETAQDVDHNRFRGFNVPEYDGRYLIAESIPHGPTRRLLAKSWEMRRFIERLCELGASDNWEAMPQVVNDEGRALLAEIDGEDQ